jgi:hypothetical protein
MFTTLAASLCAAVLGGCQSARPAHDTASQPAAPILSSDSSAFIGLAEQDLATVLGKPKLVRKDDPAEVWQYSGADCVVDFYLYDSDGRMTVAFVEARDSQADNAPTERCVKSLLQSVSVGPAEENL